MPNIQLAMERSMKDWVKTVGKQRFRRKKSISICLSEILTNELHKYLYLIFCYLYFNYQNPITIWICLTEIYKMTIACFKPTISVGSTLTHVRFITWTTQCTCWLVVSKLWMKNDLLRRAYRVSGAVAWDHNFVHQVFGAVAGDCSSLDNWRFIMLLRLGNFLFVLFSKNFSKTFQKFLISFLKKINLFKNIFFFRIFKNEF